ncbi:MAG: hypothetical protein PQJ59_13005 [Spirochaetales bacterium]|nr:hypothetical protein [Spirochaetales bacterium]
MKLKLVIQTMVVTVLVLIIGSLVFTYRNIGINDQIEEKMTERYFAFTIADEFRQTSQNLTRFARTYAATGNEKYWDEYWAIVNWRAGKTKRPSYVHKDLYRGEIKAQQEIMAEIGFTEGEFALLKEISAMSNDLINLEDQVMQSIKAGEILDGPGIPQGGETVLEFGVRNLYNKFYHDEVYKIWGTVDIFVEKLDERINNEVLELEKKRNLSNMVIQILQLLIALSVSVLAWFLITRMIRHHLGAEPAELIGLADRISQGGFIFKREGRQASWLISLHDTNVRKVGGDYYECKRKDRAFR